MRRLSCCYHLGRSVRSSNKGGYGPPIPPPSYPGPREIPYTRVGRPKYIPWKHHKSWNTKIISDALYKKTHKKCLARISRSVDANFADLNGRGIYQNNVDPRVSADVFSATGVIYAIIHIPSGRIYVGQTINSAYDRFKLHWYRRNTTDGKNFGLHHCMKNQSIRNFIVWPLEQIDPSKYITNLLPNVHDFRRIATIREEYWIRQLRTVRPCGLNMLHPISQHRSRRQRRPRRWDQHVANTRVLLEVDNYTERLLDHISFSKDRVVVSVDKGPALNSRRNLQALLSLRNNDELFARVQTMRSGHITGLLHLLSQLPVAWLQNLHIQRIEETLRSISTNRSKAMTKKKDKSSK